MKRAYNIMLERGLNDNAAEYVVIAAAPETAMKKAVRAAQEDSGMKSGWRVINLHERKEPPVL